MVDSQDTGLPAPQPVVEQAAADVRAPKVGEGNQVTYTYPILQPAEDLRDFQVGIRASVLRRCRARLKSIVDQKFPVAEVLLGISTLAGGGSLSALVSGVRLSSLLGVVFFVLLPMIAVGSGVAYGMLRNFTLRSPAQTAKDMLEDLPDPERTIDVRAK